MGTPQRRLCGAAQQPFLEVADILRAAIGQSVEQTLSWEQRCAARDIVRCRTAALGGHLEHCGACGDERPAYNSCRNRHCPKCQALPQARWVARQVERVLPVTCFHVVFTLPAELRPIARAHPHEVYKLLFDAAASTLTTLGRDDKWLGAEPGITAVLHTWARDLSLHPHLHCIVTSGGPRPGRRLARRAPRLPVPGRCHGQALSRQVPRRALSPASAECRCFPPRH